ncbi:MAG TPA: hypothetical protein DCG04_20875, partial [Rhodospirillaceae bacterium]|nr:hypothetical protein [Rhodospirillaceae bacterium]
MTGLCCRKLTLCCLALIATLWGATPAYSADFQDGWNAYQRGDFTEARKIWTTLAEAGSAKAMFNLGVLYDEGRGVAQDTKTAIKWWTQSAESGNSLAMHNLALVYIEG